LAAIRPFACEKKRFAQKFTDGRTDIQTDDGRLAIALAHSWNELKTALQKKTAITTPLPLISFTPSHQWRRQTIKSGSAFKGQLYF